MAGIYTSGASLGGFSGRFVTGVLADLIGWRGAYVVLALITLAAACAVAALLPRERHFVRSESLAASLRQMLRHLRNPQLLATYAVGFGTLFNFIATFTYINFVLAAPPYLVLGDAARHGLPGLSARRGGHADDRPLHPSARTAAVHDRQLRGVDLRDPADADPVAGRDRRGARDLRGLRTDLAGDLDRLCHADRAGRPLVRGRPLRDDLLYRRQLRRVPARPRLGAGRLAGLRRAGRAR